MDDYWKKRLLMRRSTQLHPGNKAVIEELGRPNSAPRKTDHNGNRSDVGG